MMGDFDAVANLATRNLPAARNFYEGTLGLQPIGTVEQHLVTYRTGKTKIFVYVSEFAGTNKATAITFPVGDKLDEVVKSLRHRGVRFEHYDLPGMRREGDIHVGGGMRVAWLKDPDGNLINLASS